MSIVSFNASHHLTLSVKQAYGVSVSNFPIAQLLSVYSE